MANDAHIVVLGGGFTGLRIAYLLDKLGYRITLVDRLETLGGMVQTFAYEYEGRRFLFDFGPHLFFQDYVAEYRELIGNDLLSLSDRFAMCTQDGILSYPLRPLELLTTVGLCKTAAYFLDFCLQKLRPRRRDTGEEDLDTFMTRRFGRKLFDEFYAPYIEKCCGIPPEQTDALWARERENVSGKSLADNVVKKIAGMLSRKVREQLRTMNDPAARQITAWYPRLGARQICAAMSTALNSQTVLRGWQVEAVHLDRTSVLGVDVSAGDSTQRLCGDYYVSTIPLPHLFGCFRPAETELLTVAARLRYRHVRLVNLIVARPRVLHALELFSMDPRHVFKRVYEPKAMSPHMAPDDMSSLCLEVCCFPGEPLFELADDALIARCTEDLVELRLLDNADEVLSGFVVPMPKAYPVYHKGVEQDLGRLLNRASRIENLVTCGRQGLFRYHSMTNEVMETADSVVEFLQGGRDKSRAPGTESRWGQPFF